MEVPLRSTAHELYCSRNLCCSILGPRDYTGKGSMVVTNTFTTWNTDVQKPQARTAFTFYIITKTQVVRLHLGCKLWCTFSDVMLMFYVYKPQCSEREMDYTTYSSTAYTCLGCTYLIIVYNGLPGTFPSFTLLMCYLF
jgi:hypothetical protein